MTYRKKLMTALKTFAQVDDVDTHVRDSGNIKSMVEKIGEEECEKIADMSFTIPIKDIKQIVMKAILLGRLAKARMVTRVVLPRMHLYFVGTEADVVKKLKELESSTLDGKEEAETIE